MIAELERRRARWIRRPFGPVLLTQTERQADLAGDRGACNTAEFRRRAAAWIRLHPKDAESYRLDPPPGEAG